MTYTIEITIDGNIFRYENDSLSINQVIASPEEEGKFFTTLKDSLDEDSLDKEIFYQNYDIFNLNETEYFEKYYIVEIKNGSNLVKSIWSGNSVQEVKSTLRDSHNGGEWLPDDKSLKDHLEFYVDGYCKLYTKKEFVNFIKNRKDTFHLSHSSVINYINHNF